MAADKLNIFQVLENIDTQNTKFFRALSDKEKKQFVPFVIMQWLACTDDPGQKVLLNEIVNKRVFSLYKHPELLYNLMTVCTDGDKKFYKWKKPAQRQTKFPKSVAVIKEALECSSKRAQQELDAMSSEDVLVIATDLGMQTDELKELQKELKNR